MTDQAVVSVRVALNIEFRVARTKLRDLTRGEILPCASEMAYGEGVTGLVELAGPAAGLTRLADVCVEDLTQTDDCAHIALQWNAIAADGELFTTLLADLMLNPVGHQVAVLSMAGTYWAPPGRTVAGLGQVDLGCCATAAASSFLDRVACELLHLADAT